MGGAKVRQVSQELAMSEQHRSKQESPEPSLRMSLGVLCLILFGLFAIIANISVSDIQLAPTLTVEL
jgi:hypothetical protein